MILIFGGAYQGKLDYALERFGLDESEVYNCGGAADIPGGKKIVRGIDRWVLALVRAGAGIADIEKAAGQFIETNPGAIVTCDDISCGVVPLDPVMRRWREAAGKTLAKLAQASEEVIRMFCGIPTRLK